MVVTFRCGHRAEYPDTREAAPRCAVCGDTVVSRVKVRAPVFRGVARGPCCEPVDLEPIAVQLVQKEAGS